MSSSPAWYVNTASVALKDTNSRGDDGEVFFFDLILNSQNKSEWHAQELHVHIQVMNTYIQVLMEHI